MAQRTGGIKPVGFSLLELMIVLSIGLIVGAAIFQVIVSFIRISSSEQAKLDIVQQAREFMDQMSRDLHEAGYPNPRNIAGSGVLTANPVSNDVHAAVGLVKIDSGELWFEGDVDGTGSVSVIHYLLDTSTTNNCPCLRRSQQPKVTGDPLNGQTAPSYQLEIQNVKSPDIFSAYAHGATGTPVALPLDIVSNGAAIADIDTIQAVLTVESATIDPITRKKSLVTLVSTVKLNNCSQGASGRSMSCQ